MVIVVPRMAAVVMIAALLFRIFFVTILGPVCSEESPGLWLRTSMILWPAAITNGVEPMLWPSNGP